MDYKDLTILDTKSLAERLQIEAGTTRSAFTYGSLKALSQFDHPFVIRRQMRPGSKKPKVLFVYEWFKLWCLQGNEAVDSAIREVKPQIKEYLVSLTKKPVGRPNKIEEKKNDFLKVVGGKR